MASIDLFTGFLGAGKTTFISKYCEYLAAIGVSFAVIENEYGAKGIDAHILSAHGIDTSELYGGCICCTLKVGFHDLLLELCDKYDRIIVEPSGVYDVSQFYYVMSSPELRGRCVAGNVICVVDPYSIDTLDEFSLSMLKNQVRASGCVVFSRLDGEDNNAITQYAALLKKELSDNNVRCISYSDMDSIYHCGFIGDEHIKQETTHSSKYMSTLIKPGKCDITEMKKRIARLFCENDHGEVIRVKGNWNGYLVNCVRDSLEIQRDDGDCGLNVIGICIRRTRILNILNGSDS